MNKIIQEQLAQCKVAEIPEIDPSKNSVVIKKYGNGESTISLKPHTSYIIELEDYIMYPSNSFDFHNTWNKGRVPKSKYIRAYVIQVQGKMFQFDGVGTDFDNTYAGEGYINYWLPIKSVIVKSIL